MNHNISTPRTLFDKVWETHLVEPEHDAMPALLYVDLHLIHEVTSPQAFSKLREKGLRVRSPDKTLATMDHSTPTINIGKLPIVAVVDSNAAKQLDAIRHNCREFGIPLIELGEKWHGIVHVIGPELGFTQPGMTIVCGDSHTSTHGAFGSLAFGIGSSEVAHVLATQCLLQRKPKSMVVRIDGKLKPGVTAKDIILAVIKETGIDGGTGHFIEYAGSTIPQLDMEARMTICNMSIEAGARGGMIKPDEITFEYLSNCPFSPKGKSWEESISKWKRLFSDSEAPFNKTVEIDVNQLDPMITYGTNPSLAMEIGGNIPLPNEVSDTDEREGFLHSIQYMDLKPGQKILGKKIDVVFLGSCTNSRISDLRMAASIIRDRKISKGLRMLVVPGSKQVKQQAEIEGIDEVFKRAGAEWREPGCSMCIAMNGDELSPGQYAISTSNRNFEGRQGKGGRTFLASPLTAAASALRGAIADPREFLLK